MTSISARCNSGTYIFGITNNHPAGLKTNSVGGNSAWYYRSSQLSMVGEVINPRGEPTTVTFLIQYNEGNAHHLYRK